MQQRTFNDLPDPALVKIAEHLSWDDMMALFHVNKRLFNLMQHRNKLTTLSVTLEDNQQQPHTFPFIDIDRVLLRAYHSKNQMGLIAKKTSRVKTIIWAIEWTETFVNLGVNLLIAYYGYKTLVKAADKGSVDDAVNQVKAMQEAALAVSGFIFKSIIGNFLKHQKNKLKETAAELDSHLPENFQLNNVKFMDDLITRNRKIREFKLFALPNNEAKEFSSVKRLI